MAAKRTATSDLNADNWNQEDEPEDAGTFQRASDDIISRRIVKAARRRLPAQSNKDGSVKSAFGSFTGFKTSGTCNTSSPFSFIRTNSDNNSLTAASSSLSSTKTSTTNGSIKITENGLSISTASTIANTSKTKDTKEIQSGSTEKESASPKKPPEYYAKLKGLNQGVAQWIKTHVDANPVCILTPIFRDYEKYLKEIEQKHGQETESPKAADKKSETDTVSKPTKSPKTSEEKKQTGFIFGSSSSKPVSEGQSIFGNSNDTSKSIFSSSVKSDNKSPFASASSLTSDKSFFSVKSSVSEMKKEEVLNKSEEKTTGLTFTQTPSNAGLFSFGQSSSPSTASAGFTFGTGKPFSFGAAVAKAKEEAQEKANNDEEKEDDDEPPKPDFKPITEEGSIFEQKVKVFVKRDDKYGDRGVGTLFLKPAPNDKMQLIVRAVNSLGNLLLNTLLTESIPVKRLNKTNIMLVCLPLPTSEPPPVATLLRVKTPEEADALFEALEKHKK